MSLSTVLQNLSTRIGTEFKAVRTLIGGTGTSGVSGLTTTATNLVAAINEVKTTADAASGSGGAVVNDAATSTSTVWSSSKTDSEITAALNAVVDGAPVAIDTLNELAAAIGDDANFAGTITTALGNRVRYDAAQTLNTTQQLQACTNIGVGDPETNFVTVFESALI